jgi:lipopolysaccharide export system protein LptA
MLAWQRRARLVAVTVAIAVAAAVFLTTRRREAPPAPSEVARVDPAAVIESSGAFVREVKGEKERFRVEAERQLTYSNGMSKLLGVKITVERDGKTFVVTGKEAQVSDNQSQLALTGDVHLAVSDGLKAVAGSATYSEGEGIVRAPGPVTFSRGRMSGSGVDFTYDRNRDVIGLAEQTHVTFAPDEKGADAADIQADAALLARKDKFASFERAVHIVRAHQVIDADSALADLTEDEKHITALGLQGNSRITRPDAAPGGVAAMSAQTINLTYAANSELVQRAVLAGGSSVKIAGDKGSPERTLVAESLEVGLAPDGATITSLTGRGKVALDLPAPKGQASKNIRSTALAASGNPDHGLTAAVFSEGVEYRESGGTPPVQRLVRSRTLDAALNGGLSEIRDARFTGGVQFNDGSTQATAANVRYQVASGDVDLTGNIGNAVPHVASDQIIVDAAHIELTLEGPKMRATQSVRTVMKAAKAGANGGPATKMPGLMQQDRPVYGTSDTLVYDGSNGSTTEFTGKAQLWQDDTVVQAEKVAVNGRTGNLTAEGAVKSILAIDDVDPTTKEKKTTRAIASAGSLQYDDGARRAMYQTDAHLNGPQGDLTAKTIVLYLAAAGQAVDRLEATGVVTLRENGRVTTGDHLEYVSEGETYTMSGTLVKMIEEGCRQNTGTKLTFSRSTDMLRIDGNEEARTQSTKSSADCSSPHTD